MHTCPNTYFSGSMNIIATAFFRTSPRTLNLKENRLAIRVNQDLMEFSVWLTTNVIVFVIFAVSVESSMRK